MKVSTRGQILLPLMAASLVVLSGTACHQAVPLGALVLAQSPTRATGIAPADRLDLEHPNGSRIVLLDTSFDPKHVRELSAGLAAAGDPIVSYDGQSVFFAGKASAADEWQIYQENLATGRRQQLTAQPGGAMSPALLSNGSLIFASPVPRIHGTNSPEPPAALYVQPPDGAPRQLTFSAGSLTDPTLLADGRILFVATPPESTNFAAAGPALFTINSDGTEVSAFAEQQEPNVRIERPRQLIDGRVIYLLTQRNSPVLNGLAESVRMARPFLSRAPLFPDLPARIHSVQPAGNGDLLACAEFQQDPQASLATRALFRISPTATALGAPLFLDQAWNSCEAVELAPQVKPSGRISSMDLTKQTGHILCLDANYTSDAPSSGGAIPTAVCVRVIAEITPGNLCALGELPVQADGSFMAEVPANVPLGFDTLDANGRVLRHETPMLWVRPGENRSCLGCHEPRNRSPRNHRPLAVSVPVPCLSLSNAALAQRKGDR